MISRLTARDTSLRYRDAAEVKAALDATPEAAPDPALGESA